jgi:hypothetical protein
VAAGDCGQIPYASGLPTLDTVGLMDRHIAGLPGRKHEKVDLAYVLRRRPHAVVMRTRKLLSGLPADMRLATHPAFLAAYRLAHAEPYTTQAYLVFVKEREPSLPPNAAIDLVALLPQATRTVLGPAGARAAGDHIRAGYRYTVLPTRRVEELGALGPTEGGPPPDVPAMDAALRELAPATHHGIAFQLPEGDTEGAVDFTLGPLPRGGTLRLALGFAPWLWYEGRLRHAAASLSVRVTGKGSSFVHAASLTSDPARREADRGFSPLSVAIPPEPRSVNIQLRVRREGDPAAATEPFEVLLSSPEIAVAGEPS